MRTDISLMKAFYENALGQAAARQIARRVETLWPNLKGETVMGFGYTPPILEPILIKAGAGRVMSLMPAEQGGWAWPVGKKCLNAVTNETNLPFLIGPLIGSYLCMLSKIHQRSGFYCVKSGASWPTPGA